MIYIILTVNGRGFLLGNSGTCHPADAIVIHFGRKTKKSAYSAFLWEIIFAKVYIAKC